MRFRQRSRTPIAEVAARWTVGAAASMALAASAAAQVPPPSDTAPPPAPAPAPPPALVARPPLLREGSSLLRAPATLRRDERSGTWIATLRDDLETARDREVTLAPCEGLEDMIRVIRGRTEVQWFELTGLVLTYRGRNYVLPQLATPLSTEPPRAERRQMLPPGASPPVPAAPPGARPTVAAPAPAPTAVVASAPPNAPTAPSPPSPSTVQAPPPTAPVDPERFASDIERELESRIRVIPRSSDAVPAPSPFAAGRPGPILSDQAERTLLATAVRVHDRRGVVSRDPLTGTWRFVFQSDRAEIGERGVELLPCAVLERLERFVRESETVPALLVSGRLTRFEGRNYLLPSSFRTVASGRWIAP